MWLFQILEHCAIICSVTIRSRWFDSKIMPHFSIFIIVWITWIQILTLIWIKYVVLFSSSIFNTTIIDVCSRLGKESGSEEGDYYSFLLGLAKLKKPKTLRFGISRFVSSSLISYFGFWHNFISNQEYNLNYVIYTDTLRDSYLNESRRKWWLDIYKENLYKRKQLFLMLQKDYPSVHTRLSVHLDWIKVIQLVISNTVY